MRTDTIFLGISKGVREGEREEKRREERLGELGALEILDNHAKGNSVG